MSCFTSPHLWAWPTTDTKPLSAPCGHTSRAAQWIGCRWLQANPSHQDITVKEHESVGCTLTSLKAWPLTLSPAPPRIEDLWGRLEDPLAVLLSRLILRLRKLLFSSSLNGSLYAISVVFWAIQNLQKRTTMARVRHDKNKSGRTAMSKPCITQMVRWALFSRT